jgi:ribosomal protein S18 acetylase RimI-like enzyme
MGEVFRWQKPKFIKKIISSNYEIKTVTSIERSVYNMLSSLIEKAKEIIVEDITLFSEKTFLKDLDNKTKMNFRISLAFDNQELIGYGIGYCPLDNISEFYIDVVYVINEFQSKSIGFNLTCSLINSIQNIDSIEQLKFITQENNEKAKRMIEKIKKYYS